MIKQKLGISLLELLLVLVVIAVVLVLAARRYEVYRLKVSVLTMQRTVGTLINEFNLYYGQHCASGWQRNQTVTLNQLGLNVMKVPNPFGSTHYSFGSDDKPLPGSQQLVRQLYVKVPFDQRYHDNLAYFQGKLKANRIYPNQQAPQGLEWRFAPFQKGVRYDPLDPNWLLRMNRRKFIKQQDKDNPCWFPPA